MKAKFARLMGLMLTLALLLSGCNLIEIDVKMQAEEDIARLDKAYSTVVASYDGGEITAGEAMSLFNANYNEMYYMYQYYFGMEISAEEVHELMDNVLLQMVRSEVAASRFDAEHTLSDAELAQVEADAQTYYDEAYAGLYQSAVGDNDEAKEAATMVLLKEVGMDAETNYANTLMEAKAIKMEEILMAEVAEISEDELLAAYEDYVSSDEDIYSVSDGSFESAMMEETPNVYWIPEGYRTVKHILLIPDDALMTAYSEAEFILESEERVLEGLQDELDALLDNDAETTLDAELMRSEEEIRADIASCEAQLPELRAAVDAAEQACLDSVQDKTDAIYARLEAGEDFEALMAEYGEDPGMQNEPTMSRGYYVSASSANWEENFTGGAMALANVGDYSAEPVLSGSGVHIILYASDVQAGAVALEDVRDTLYAAALEEKQYTHVDETISAWVNALNPSYDVEAFEKAIFDSVE